MNSSSELNSSPETSSLWRRAILLALFGVLLRLVLLAILFKITHGNEFADDFNAYRIFLKHPLILFNADGLQDVPDAVVYSPLIPIQVWFPGALVSSQIGTFLGHRLCMILYDGIALLITAWAMVREFPGAWSKKHWIAGLLLMCVPGSVGASALFGQEDCIAAMWTALAMIALVRGHPTIAALFGGIGLFTHKLFALLLSWGIFISAPKSRLKIFLTTGSIVLIFFAFLYIRFRFTGMMLASYSYSAMSNSPSPWAMINRLLGDDPFSFDQFKPYIMLSTIVLMLLVSLPLRRGKTVVEASIIATHCTFFVIFIGIQPEHHQWFMPFMIFFAWRRFLAGDYFTMLLAWSYSGFAYGYKILGGLAGKESLSSAGKEVFRSWFGSNAAPILGNLQLVFHILTMLVGILVVYRAIMTRQPHEQIGDAK